MISVQDIPREIEQRTIAALLDSNAPGEAFVSTSQRRMENSGDSEHKYPDLWDHPRSYRRGGMPLLDTRQTIYNSLGYRSDQAMNGVTLSLEGSDVAGYHQTGFTTKGPHYIPLTVRGRRRDSNAKQGKDFIVIRGGVTVPQRKIANVPPEDISDIVDSIKLALRTMR